MLLGGEEVNHKMELWLTFQETRNRKDLCVHLIHLHHLGHCRIAPSNIFFSTMSSPSAMSSDIVNQTYTASIKWAQGQGIKSLMEKPRLFSAVAFKLLQFGNLSGHY